MNALINTQIKVIDLGLIDYAQALDYQLELFNANLDIKKSNRDPSTTKQKPTLNHLLFCEHPHVYTLGKSGKEKNLLIQQNELNTIQASYYPTNRGGDITYHGPGQLVVYLIIDLENFFTDIHQYMRLLEETIILTLQEFNIISGRIRGLTGVWVDYENEKTARKICAFGVKTSRWVTMHGLALNINTNLNYFNNIVPCGITDKSVTSMQKEMGKTIDLAAVKTRLTKNIISQFGMTLVA